MAMATASVVDANHVSPGEVGYHYGVSKQCPLHRDAHGSGEGSIGQTRRGVKARQIARLLLDGGTDRGAYRIADD
jgi:hypothetical protein